MCPPDVFGIPAPHATYGAANAFQARHYEEYARDPMGFREKAKTQWLDLLHAIEDADGAVLELPVRDNEHDGPFTADASLTFQKENGERVILITQFANLDRQTEADNHHFYLSRLFPDADITAHRYACEGTGDNVYDPYRKCFWSGYIDGPAINQLAAGRSDPASHPVLAAKTGVAVHSLEVRAPYFHIDTALAALPNGHLLVNEDGLHHEALRHIRREAFTPHKLDTETHLHLIGGQDAEDFACNIIVVNNTLIMPKTGDAVRKVLEDWGYHVVQVDVSQFIKAGGGVHCLTNFLDTTF
jgi:N-dimethylarginine dimethylaminohydrolase